jgi:integrase
MSVYKPKKSPFYAYDFQLDGRRFHGSTGAKGKREAEKVEAAERQKAESLLKSERAVGHAPLTIDLATARYWQEVGQHHAGRETTWTNLGRLVDHFGPAKLLAEITDDDVARLAAWRRSQTVKGRQTVRNPLDPRRSVPAPLISLSTVNRSTIEPLQKLFNRARRVWKVLLPNEPDWSLHLLREPTERVREVRQQEERSLEEAIRPDYLPLIRFARAAGLRLAECLMKKSSVDLHVGRIRTRGKGGKPIDHPITADMRAILMAEMANPTDSVFTYAAVRAMKGPKGHPRGARLPITASGLKTMWRRSRTSKTRPVLPPDLRFHDLRHDFATKLLRETGNLKLVQRALHHSKVETTTRYAHVLDEEVLAGMEAVEKSRKKSRTPESKAG